MSGYVLISFCIPPSLQVSVCWCLMGGSQKTLPGKCTWSSTRRTAGEGLLLRQSNLLHRLLSFNLSTRCTTSLVSHPATASPPLFAWTYTANMHGYTRILPYREYTCTVTCAVPIHTYRCRYIHKPACGPSSSCRHYRGGHDVSQIHWQLQTDCITALSYCLSAEIYTLWLW